MRRRVRWGTTLATIVVAVAGVGIASAARPRGAQPDKSENIRLIAHFPVGSFREGSDIDFDGNRVYTAQFGERGGIQIFDAGRPVPRLLAGIACPGVQNDVATVRPGLIALGYHDSSCVGARRGVRLIDVSNPQRPRFLGSVRTPGGTHTLTVHPRRPLIYASPGGNSSIRSERNEVIIDVSNARRPRIVARFDPEVAGCHDLTFHIRRARKLAFCAGDTETQIWDVSQPRRPKILSHIDNPAVSFNHSVAVTSDGKLAVIGDESSSSNCKGAPTGAMFAYDVTDPKAPVEQGYFAVPRGPATTDPWSLFAQYGCTAHNFSFRRGTRMLAASWYWGGMNVVDWSDADAPVEVAHFRTEGTYVWSAYWHRGRIYANGSAGLDVFSIHS